MESGVPGKEDGSGTKLSGTGVKREGVEDVENRRGAGSNRDIQSIL
jgi:hypothetical protein